MTALQPLPTAISSFSKLRKNGFVYIDKTDQIYDLVKHPGAYFLARPRRFGKSLLLSTFEEIFKGNEELFSGLAIETRGYQWQSFPVIRIDFNLIPVRSADELDAALKKTVNKIAEAHGLHLDDGPSHALFRDLILTLGDGTSNVVVLIDEYDKPIIDNLTQISEAKKIRDTLKTFYTMLKATDEHIRFAFLTGVSRFTKAGIFSDINHLNDLTLEKSAATLCGITDQELAGQLHQYFISFGEQNSLSTQQATQQFKRWYNGFSFSSQGTSVYNPFSAMHALANKRFGNYWFMTGTPTFLLRLLKESNYAINSLDNLQVNEIAFASYDLENLPVVPLLFQTGYLTIKDYDSASQIYTLDYPNYEVEHAFLAHLLDHFANNDQGLSLTHLEKLKSSLRLNDLPTFFENLQILLANIEYDLQLNYEKYYQSVFYLLFKLIGLHIEGEVRTNNGRIDAVVKVEDRIYIFEFKINAPAQTALEQIKDKKYAQKYMGDRKQIICVGVSFSTLERQVAEWKSLPLDLQDDTA